MFRLQFIFWYKIAFHEQYGYYTVWIQREFSKFNPPYMKKITCIHKMDFGYSW